MFKDSDLLPQENIRTIPSFAITDISEIWDHLSKNNWEIPDGIRVLHCDRKEDVQRKIDQIFPKFIEHIQYAREGKKDIMQVRKTGIVKVSNSDNIIHYSYLRFNLWGNFEGKTDDFLSDINRIQNCFIMYMSPNVQNEIVKGVDSEQPVPSEEDLKFTRDFMGSVLNSMQKDMFELDQYDRGK